MNKLYNYCENEYNELLENYNNYKEKNFKSGRKYINQNAFNGFLKRFQEVKVGFRYGFFWGCVALAKKCNMPKKDIKPRLMEAFKHFEIRDKDDPFTEEELDEAIDAYDDPKTLNVKGKTIYKKAHFKYTPSKRNYRSRKEHLDILHNQQSKEKEVFAAFDNLNNICKNNHGQDENYKDSILFYSQNELVKLLGYSKGTIYKYYDKYVGKKMQDYCINYLQQRVGKKIYRLKDFNENEREIFLDILEEQIDYVTSINQAVGNKIKKHFQDYFDKIEWSSYCI